MKNIPASPASGNPVPAERTLFPQHLHKLQTSSGISLEVIAETGYYSTDDPAELERLRFPGALVPALVIPVCSPDGVHVHQLRPDNPGEGPKYRTPGDSSLRVHVPPRMLARVLDPSEPLEVVVTPVDPEAEIEPHCLDFLWPGGS